MPADRLDAARKTLMGFALGLPGAYEDHPWGDTVVKVGKKIFVFVGETREGGLGLSVKLPQSSEDALELPFVEPTGYGLGKAGWVSASFDAGAEPPVEMLCHWIDESYQAVAPSKLAALARASAPSADDAGDNTASAAKPRKPLAARTPARRPAAGSAKRAARPARRRG